MNSEKYRTYTTALLCGLLLLILLSTPAAGQEYREYLLKKVGNLYILNVGANDNVKGYQIYNLFFEDVTRFPILRIPLKTNREYFGAVQVTQLFPEYCVVRIVARYMEEEPEGNRIVLVKRELPDAVLRRAYESSGLTLPKEVQKDLEKKIREAAEGETITKQIDMPVRDESFRPFSLGANYYYMADNYSKPVAGHFQTLLDNALFGSAGVFTAGESGAGGFGLNLSKMLTPRFLLRGGFGYSAQDATLEGSAPDIVRTPGIRYVDRWNFDIKTKIVNWSLALHYSSFDKALSYFTGDIAGRKFAPRIGLGVDYASVNVELDERVSIAHYDKFAVDNIAYEQRTVSEKFSLGGYWGLRTVAGLDYYIQAGKVFVELNYLHWFSDKFDSSLPVRIGGEIFF